jgi:hypothetical protein
VEFHVEMIFDGLNPDKDPMICLIMLRCKWFAEGMPVPKPPEILAERRRLEHG